MPVTVTAAFHAVRKQCALKILPLFGNSKKSDHFTKTGSGQTQGRLKQGTAFYAG